MPTINPAAWKSFSVKCWQIIGLERFLPSGLDWIWLNDHEMMIWFDCNLFFIGNLSDLFKQSPYGMCLTLFKKSLAARHHSVSDTAGKDGAKDVPWPDFRTLRWSTANIVTANLWYTGWSTHPVFAHCICDLIWFWCWHLCNHKPWKRYLKYWRSKCEGVRWAQFPECALRFQGCRNISASRKVAARTAPQMGSLECMVCRRLRIQDKHEQNQNVDSFFCHYDVGIRFDCMQQSELQLTTFQLHASHAIQIL